MSGPDDMIEAFINKSDAGVPQFFRETAPLIAPLAPDFKNICEVAFEAD
jgi:hypothetical protein